MKGWKSIPGFSFYKVNSCGDVASIKCRQARILKPFIKGKGKKRTVTIYSDVHKKFKSIFISRLVLLAFKGKPTKKLKCAIHIDGNNLNDNLSNLKWGSSSEVISRTYAKYQVGGRSKSVVVIKQDSYYGTLSVNKFKSMQDAATKFGINVSTIKRYCDKNYNNNAGVWSYGPSFFKLAK